VTMITASASVNIISTSCWDTIDRTVRS
jgi:hypothetical protein